MSTDTPYPLIINLKNQRWIPLTLAHPDPSTHPERSYFIKSYFEETQYVVAISDFINVWIECVNQEQIKTKISKFAKQFEASRFSSIMNQVSRLARLYSSTEHSNTMSISMDASNTLHLSASSRIKKLIFPWVFECTPYTQLSAHMSTSTFFYENVTLPLLVMLQQGQERETQLLKKLKQKDNELDAFELELNLHNVSRKPKRSLVFAPEAWKKESQENVKPISSSDSSQISSSVITDMNDGYDVALQSLGYTSGSGALGLGATGFSLELIEDDGSKSPELFATLPEDIVPEVPVLSQEEIEMERRKAREAELKEINKKNEAKKKRKKL